MKLNKQGKEEVRAKIVEQLQNVPVGQRVHLDKELLEELLFEEVTIYDSPNGYEHSSVIGKGRVISWSGDFLQKIDLSEVSFEDVIWRNYNYITNPEAITQDLLFENVNLSNTNVNIDFSKSFDAKHPTDYWANEVPVGTKSCVCISNVNFSGVDLSNSNFEYVGMIDDTCLDYTKAPIIIEEPSEEMYYLRIKNSSLKGIDLSKYTINAINLCPNLSETGLLYTDSDIKEFKEDEETYRDSIAFYEKGIRPKRIEISNCNLQNTGININFDETDKTIEQMCDRSPSVAISEDIKNGSLIGCYVNGKRILSLEERQAIAQEKLAEYEKMKEDLISATTSSIEQQTSGFGRK